MSPLLVLGRRTHQPIPQSLHGFRVPRRGKPTLCRVLRLGLGLSVFYLLEPPRLMASPGLASMGEWPVMIGLTDLFPLVAKFSLNSASWSKSVLMAEMEILGVAAAPLGGRLLPGECAGEKVQVHATIPDVSRLLWPSSSRHSASVDLNSQATENKAKASLLAQPCRCVTYLGGSENWLAVWHSPAMTFAVLKEFLLDLHPQVHRALRQTLPAALTLMSANLGTSTHDSNRSYEQGWCENLHPATGPRQMPK